MHCALKRPSLACQNKPCNINIHITRRHHCNRRRAHHRYCRRHLCHCHCHHTFYGPGPATGHAYGFHLNLVITSSTAHGHGYYNGYLMLRATPMDYDYGFHFGPRGANHRTYRPCKHIRSHFLHSQDVAVAARRALPPQ